MKKNYYSKGQPGLFFLFIGNGMYECEVVEKREKAIRVKATEHPDVFKGYAWIPKSGLLSYKDRSDEYMLANWVKLKWSKHNDPKPPPRPSNWDGYSRKGQAQETAYFEYEMEMIEKVDPSDPYGKYDHLI
jgi:hypothetical protein